MKPKVLDLTMIEGLSRIMCTIEEMAVVMGVDPKTMDRHIAQDEGLREAIERGRAGGRAALRRYQFQAAKELQPTMLVWLGKQLLGQKDVIDVDHHHDLVVPDFSRLNPAEISELKRGLALIKKAQEPLTIEHDPDDA